MSNGSAKVDRRRQNRVQGGWSKPVFSNSNIDPPMKTNQREKNHGQALAHSQRNFTTPQESSNFAHAHGGAKFAYDRSAMVSAKRERDEERGPAIRRITDEGIYNLDDTSFVRFFPRFLEKSYADQLYDKMVVNLPWQQRTGINREGSEYKEPRMTCWFGEPYVYSHVAWESNPEWPEMLVKLRSYIEEKTGGKYNSVMCNYYRDGKDSIGWHADDEPSLGKNPDIASISLGCPRNFEVRRREDHYSGKSSEGGYYSILLPHGSLLLMGGTMQEFWLHRVPKEYHDKPGRINLTFRVIIKSPNDRLEVSESTHKIISRGEDDDVPATIGYKKDGLSKQLLEDIRNEIPGAGEFVRPSRKDNISEPFQLIAYTSYDTWPSRMQIAAREVANVCTSRGELKFQWSSAQFILLQRGTEHVPWRFEKGQNPVALACLWGGRPIKLRVSRNMRVKGDLKEVTVTRCNPGDIFVMEGNLQRHWQFSIPRDPPANYGTCFLLLRAEEPYPTGMTFHTPNGVPEKSASN